MSVQFSPADSLIIVPTRLWGPAGDTVARLALDTGATQTMVNWGILTLLGYGPEAFQERVQVTTGSDVVFVPRTTIEKLEALGHLRHSFPVLCHSLPPSAGVDGVLGLDFLRGQRLILDFRAGMADLA